MQANRTCGNLNGVLAHWACQNWLFATMMLAARGGYGYIQRGVFADQIQQGAQPYSRRGASARRGSEPLARVLYKTRAAAPCWVNTPNCKSNNKSAPRYAQPISCGRFPFLHTHRTTAPPHQHRAVIFALEISCAHILSKYVHFAATADAFLRQGTRMHREQKMHHGRLFYITGNKWMQTNAERPAAMN